jgi:hypothetical protein
MSKAPLKTKRLMFALAVEMGLQAHGKHNFFKLCAMLSEFEDLCARYTGPASDLDSYRQMAEGAVKRAFNDIILALVDEFKSRTEAE